MFKLKKRSRKS